MHAHFYLVSFQGIVMRVWASVEEREKGEIRHFLMEFLAARSMGLPLFIRNKLVQVLVLIGQADWPHAYPDMMDYILQVCLCVCTCVCVPVCVCVCVSMYVCVC